VETWTTAAAGWQTARLEDKILTGTEPREILVEVRIKLQFVIYLKTTKALRLTIAPLSLFQANELIRCAWQLPDACDQGCGAQTIGG